MRRICGAHAMLCITLSKALAYSVFGEAKEAWSKTLITPCMHTGGSSVFSAPSRKECSELGSPQRMKTLLTVK